MTNPETPTGMEMALKMVVRLLGVKPEHIIDPMNDIRNKVLYYDQRFEAIERGIAEINRKLDGLAK